MTTLSTPGVLVTRRHVLELPAVAAVFGLARSARRSDPLDFEAFTAACAEHVQAHLDEARALPEALLLQLAEAGARLDPADVPRPSLGAFGGYEPKVAFGPVHRAATLMMIEWKLEPNAVLPAHNHSPVHVLSLCLEGSCRVEHFEIVGDAPAPGEPGDFRMRRTRAQLLRPGQATSLTPERDNIHTFRAGPAGALGLDLNVAVAGQGSWSMIAHAQAAEQGFEELHEAHWIGKPK